MVRVRARVLVGHSLIQGPTAPSHIRICSAWEIVLKYFPPRESFSRIWCRDAPGYPHASGLVELPNHSQENRRDILGVSGASCKSCPSRWIWKSFTFHMNEGCFSLCHLHVGKPKNLSEEEKGPHPCTLSVLTRSEICTCKSWHNVCDIWSVWRDQLAASSLTGPLASLWLGTVTACSPSIRRRDDQ